MGASCYVADFADNPELLIDLERFLPGVIGSRSRIEQALVKRH
jgi:hypothetical protein